MKKIYTLLLLSLFLSACQKNQDIPEETILPPTDEGSDFVTVIQDEVRNADVVIAGSSGKNFIVSFYRTLEDGTILDFRSTDQNLPVLMVDNEGNSWDVFGKAVSGPRMGTFLRPTKSCMGYFFAFNALYPGVEIYNGPPRGDISGGFATSATGWAIPTDYVVEAISIGAIPSLDNPPFWSYDNAMYPEEDFYVADDDLIVGVQDGTEAKAYPHAILDWHEVINDRVGEEALSVNYCPLTGTAQVWKQEVDGTPNRFGVSGFLLNSNLMPIDFETESIWMQLEGKCVFGEKSGAEVATLPFIETTWETWKEMFDTPLVVAEETGEDRDYRVYPYGNYKINHDYIAYPIEFRDTRLLSKERVHGIIINNGVKVYQISDF